MFTPGITAPDDISQALHIVFQRSELITDMRAPEACLIAGADIQSAGWRPRSRHFMGFWHSRPCFALEIDEPADVDPMRYQRGSLYQILGRVEEPLFALAGRASQLLSWERDHQFCGRCGSPMEADGGERAMHCPSCGFINYPRIAPCIITLVTRGEEMLLARAANFPIEMYSTLAGFIEAGENAEECLAREVQEEVGIEVGGLRYFQSQSWPFPNQLMLGFFAEYRSGEIKVDGEEIIDAGWYTADNLPTVPPPASISGQLIRAHIHGC
ncbi:MAG: NAD(+) diphosphatase [Pseudomonadota bacterium]